MKIKQLLGLTFLSASMLLLSSCQTLNGPFSGSSVGGRTWDTINDASLYRSQDNLFRR